MLIEQLNELAEYVSDQIDDINHGGCAVFAALVGKHLEKYVPVRIIVYGYSNEDDYGVQLNLHKVKRKITRIEDGVEWNNNGICFCHLLVEFDYRGKRYHYDSGGVNDHYCYKDYDAYKGYLTVSEVDKLSQNRHNWNSCFDRSNIPRMKRFIDTKFKQIGWSVI